MASGLLLIGYRASACISSCAAEWKAFQKVSKNDKDLQSWEANLNAQAHDFMKSLQGAGGGDHHDFIDILKSIVAFASDSNAKHIVQQLALLKEIMGSTKKKKENEERVNVLVDEYMTISSTVLDFLSEMDRFLNRSRNSHSYITSVIEKYFNINDGRELGSAEQHHRVITDHLRKLRDSDNIFDLSAENLLKKVESLITQHTILLDKLKLEYKKICEEEEVLKKPQKVLVMIFTGALIGLCIAAIVCVFVATPAVATKVIPCISPAVGLTAWILSLFEEAEKAFNYHKKHMEDVEATLAHTRVSIKELGNVKASINDVITKIDSLLFTPSSVMDQGEIDFTMKLIKTNLEGFLNKVEDLQGTVDNTRKEIMKARDDVHIKQEIMKARNDVHIKHTHHASSNSNGCVIL